MDPELATKRRIPVYAEKLCSRLPVSLLLTELFYFLLLCPCFLFVKGSNSGMCYVICINSVQVESHSTLPIGRWDDS